MGPACWADRPVSRVTKVRLPEASGRMRFCSYTVVHDTGFAPNAFGGYCTLAACTPNHQGLQLGRGDWLMGHATAECGRGLIYAMEVCEVLDYDEYHADPRFGCKKPRFDRSWREACGDNIYFRRNDRWRQERTLFHADPEDVAKDTRYHKVFVGERFWYFGACAPAIPPEFGQLLRDRQGCKCSHPDGVVEGFIAWLSEFSPGRHGDPRDLDWVEGRTSRCDGHRPRD
jgi:Nucleotide modification associated domain 2